MAGFVHPAIVSDLERQLEAQDYVIGELSFQVESLESDNAQLSCLLQAAYEKIEELTNVRGC